MVSLKSYTAADALAADLLSLPFITGDEVVRVFRMLPQPQNKSRVNVVPEGQTFVDAQCAGLTTRRGHHLSLSSLDSKAPNVVRLVSRFATDFDSHFTFTTATINFSHAAKAHVDTNHLDGRARVVSLGDFTGGELWVDNLGVHDVKWPNWLDFDATQLHRVEPFEGERYSIVYFTHELTGRLPPALSAELIKVGLPLPARGPSTRYFVASQPCLRPPGLFRSTDNGSLAAFVEPELRAALCCPGSVLDNRQDTISDWIALNSVICNEEAIRVQRSLVGSSVVEVLLRGPLPFDASYGPLCALIPSFAALHIEVQMVPEKNGDRRSVLTAFWKALNIDRQRGDRPTLKLFLVTKGDTWFLCRPVSPQHLSCDGVQKENIAPPMVDGFSPLKPELAALMCNLAQVRAHGLVLDPFCGSGRIPEAVEALGACALSADVRGSVVSVYDNTMVNPCTFPSTYSSLRDSGKHIS
eukprot:GEMP01029640.1.p1 GENE.GEMP01029640.1~~GEMP01029640.1.p1  ORF type:complete len:469 (-),score=114.81 GEMP01029640.1:731-2137(-)